MNHTTAFSSVFYFQDITFQGGTVTCHICMSFASLGLEIILGHKIYLITVFYAAYSLHTINVLDAGQLLIENLGGA